MRYAKLIGPSNEPEDLEEYSNQLLLRYIKEQVVLFPSSKRIIQSWIVVAGDLFDGVIIHDEIPTLLDPDTQQEREMDDDVRFPLLFQIISSLYVFFFSFKLFHLSLYVFH